MREYERMKDNDKARLALTPLFLCLEKGGILDDDLCNTLLRSVVLLISSERYRCFDIVLEKCEDVENTPILHTFLDAAGKIQSGEDVR